MRWSRECASGSVRSLQETDEPAWVTRQAIQDFMYEENGLHASPRRFSKICGAWELDYYSRLERAPVALDPFARSNASCVHSRGAVQSNMVLFYSISTKAAPIFTTHTAIVSRICIVSVRRAAWTTGPHPQAVCLVTQLPLLLPLLLPQPLLPPLMFLQSAVCCCCCCRLLPSCRCCAATAEPLCSGAASCSRATLGYSALTAPPLLLHTCALTGRPLRLCPILLDDKRHAQWPLRQ